MSRLPSGSPYAFCETMYASATSPWHIRGLTEKGPKFGGGADTSALCGRKVAWDLDVEITKHHLTHVHKDCVEKFDAELKEVG